AWKLIYSIFAYLAQILTSNPDGACEQTQLTRRPWQYRNAVAVSSYLPDIGYIRYIPYIARCRTSFFMTSVTSVKESVAELPSPLIIRSYSCT
ncbi:hypothetical protein QUA30_06455, partial [Microcoleus sp. Pol14C2]|uniref:hypothetical protein n=1 Tax=unclassified Microcoleus TaxID=2642155 RepID=UPI002FCF7723